MDDVSSDKHVADTLRQLYDHPDMVELYPGLFLEDAKPAMNPGCGGCPPYTVGRGVFSDAVTLVRSDRFYTLVGASTCGHRARADSIRTTQVRRSRTGDWRKSNKTSRRRLLMIYDYFLALI